MKTNYIPHSIINSISLSKANKEKIVIYTKEGFYTTSYGFTTDNNGIHGEFYKEEQEYQTLDLEKEDFNDDPSIWG